MRKMWDMIFGNELVADDDDFGESDKDDDVGESSL